MPGYGIGGYGIGPYGGTTVTPFAATPEPDNVPPRIRLDLRTDDTMTAFTALKITRDGVPIRTQPPVGSSVSVTYDYEAPFGSLAQYAVEGLVLPPTNTDWSESWVNLAAWTGSGWIASGGKAQASVAGVTLARSASGAIGRLDVTDPVYAGIELRDAANAVVVSILVGLSTVTLTTAAGAVTTAGGGSLSLVLAGGVATVSGSGWSLSAAFTGTPVKVQLVSQGLTGSQLGTWATGGLPYSVALDSAGNVYVADWDYKLIRKFNAAGAQIASWSTTGIPYGVAVDGAGNVYVIDTQYSLLRKYNAAGTQVASWSTTDVPLSMALDAAGNVYVGTETNLAVSTLRKYNAAGTQVASWSTVGAPYSVALDSAGNVYVADGPNKLIRKYDPAGTQIASWSTTGTARGVAVDALGSVYVVDYDNKVVRKYNTIGTQNATWSTTGAAWGIALDASAHIYVADGPNKLIRKYAQVFTGIGQIIETPPATEEVFSDTDTATLTPADAWLIHPATPGLSLDLSGYRRPDALTVQWSSAEEIGYAQQAEIFSPVGRPRQVVITNGTRRDGAWTMRLFAPTLALRDDVLAALNDQTPLLLRVPPAFGWDLPDGYYAVGDVTDTRDVGDFNLTDHSPTPKVYRTLTLPLTPVDAPIVAQTAQWTWGDVLTGYATWADVLAQNGTWFDVLAGPS